jgi:hypothetical protein
MQSSSKKLRVLCTSKKIRITTLMNLMGLSRAMVSAHVNGYREPSWEQRREYERVLKLPEMHLEADELSPIESTSPKSPENPLISPSLGQSDIGRAFNNTLAPSPLDILDLGEANVAASHFVESQVMLEATDVQLAGRQFIYFTLTITGDCMVNAENPRDGWYSGERVIFRRMRDRMDAWTIGKDYYIEWRDNGSTFKRLVAFNEQTITLQCISDASIKFIIPQVDVLNAARAVGRLQD